MVALPKWFQLAEATGDKATRTARWNSATCAFRADFVRASEWCLTPKVRLVRASTYKMSGPYLGVSPSSDQCVPGTARCT
jgi:hypothetical protein